MGHAAALIHIPAKNLHDVQFLASSTCSILDAQSPQLNNLEVVGLHNVISHDSYFPFLTLILSLSPTRLYWW
jgi:hypothetical protein